METALVRGRLLNTLRVLGTALSDLRLGAFTTASPNRPSHNETSTEWFDDPIQVSTTAKSTRWMN